VLVAETRGRDVIARAQPNLKATHGAVWGRRVAMRAAGPARTARPGRACSGTGAACRAKQAAIGRGTWKRIIRERLWRRVVIEGAA
jgi:coenzyme F420 hydrogenase subunit beta